jgi:hypothetical protein
MSDEGIFRVTVRGRFADLGGETRAALLAALDEHDVTRAAFTREGTFMYDMHLNAFSLRYEVRVAHDEGELVAGDIAVREADMFLSVMGYPHGPLRSSVVDMATSWGTRPR